MRNKILVIVAHPDDEVLGCGGAIIKHIREGSEVHVIVLADGVTSRMYNPEISRKKELNKFKKEIAVRKNEFLRAAAIMGIEKEKCHWFVLPDQRLDNLPILDVIKQIERIAKRVIPDTVYTHHWGDLNKDHRICCEAVITALRPKTQKINKNKTKILCFEINGNMGILPPKAVNKFRPDHYVDITGSKDQKTKAMEAYQSELQDYPGIFSSINMLLLAKKRAKKHNYKYAEAFEQICFGDE